MTYKLASILPVWFLAGLGAILVGVFFVADDRLTWLALVFAACVLVTFGIQLALAKGDGFVSRAMSSIGGALIILAVATGIVLLVS